MNFNQIIVRLVLKNTVNKDEDDNEAQIYSIELNILDNANIRLVRDEVYSYYLIVNANKPNTNMLILFYINYSLVIRMSRLNLDLLLLVRIIKMPNAFST